MASNFTQSEPSRITSYMVNQLQPTAQETKLAPIPSAPQWCSPQLMVVFEDGDLHSARHQLLQSLQNPFAEGSVATLLLQESIADQFVGLVAQDLRPLSQEVSKHPSYTITLAKIEELKAKTVQGESLKAGESPVLVYDCVHSYLGNGATGVVTVHTFRTAKEAGQLAKRDPLPYGQVSLWNEKLGCAYELIPRLPSDIVAINCFNPDLDPIWESFAADRNDVLLAKNYHYESLVVSGKRRIVVFPVGTIFGN
uniref:CG15717-PA n=1 Tax=Drosophila melanogaster TaxID=7227 RepID=B4F5F2_DROME|nr:CG15717-PA [Drosophila melanogaster]